MLNAASVICAWESSIRKTNKQCCLSQLSYHREPPWATPCLWDQPWPKHKTLSPSRLQMNPSQRVESVFQPFCSLSNRNCTDSPHSSDIHATMEWSSLITEKPQFPRWWRQSNLGSTPLQCNGPSKASKAKSRWVWETHFVAWWAL